MFNANEDPAVLERYEFEVINVPTGGPVGGSLHEQKTYADRFASMGSQVNGFDGPASRVPPHRRPTVLPSLECALCILHRDLYLTSI